MSLFANLINKYKRATPKQLALTGVFMLAFAAAIGGGFASKQSSFAAGQSYRDCDYNSIDNKWVAGGCGALTPGELITDLKNNNPSDLQTIYADSRIGLPFNKYDRFASKAVEGSINKAGNVIDDQGDIVMTDVWTMGRTTLGSAQRTPIVIGGKTYYHSPPSVSFGQYSLDAMILFDDEGTVEAVVLESCGNPVTQGKKIKSGATCDKLVKHPVDGKKNTYQFSAEASKFGLAKFVKFEYFINDSDKPFATTSTARELTKEVAFTKASTVTVKVTFGLPGHQTKTVTSVLCKKEIGVVKEEFLHVCEALLKTTIDNKTFRFNAVAKHSNNVELVSVDFTLDGNVTVKGVTTDEDNDGNIDRTYTFTDNKAHSVSAVINFLADGKEVQSKESCVAATPETPVCPEKPNLPPDHPECKELPKTGPAGVAGLFAGVTAAGAIAHRLFMSRRARLSE